MNRAEQLIALCEASSKEVTLSKELDNIAWDIADETGVAYKVVADAVAVADWFLKNKDANGIKSIPIQLMDPNMKKENELQSIATTWAKKGIPQDITKAYANSFRAPRIPSPKDIASKTAISGPKPITRREYEKRCKGAWKDYEADMRHDGEEPSPDAAYDIADGLLYDGAFLAFCQKEFNTLNRQLIKEIVADEIYG